MMRRWLQMNCGLWAMLIGILCVFMTGGCSRPHLTRVPSTGSDYITGVFLEKDNCIAKLDVKNVASARPESTRVWKTTLKANNQGVYNVIVKLYARSFRGMGFRIYTSPVWELEVNGRSVTKDAKGYGNWGWNRGLTVNGVELKITTCSPYPVPIEAYVRIEDASLW